MSRRRMWFLGSAIAIVAGYFLFREPLHTDPRLTGPWQNGEYFLVFDENHSAYLAELHEGSVGSARAMRYSATGGELRVNVLDEEGGTGQWTTYEMHLRSEDGELSLTYLPDGARNGDDVLGRTAGGHGRELASRWTTPSTGVGDIRLARRQEVKANEVAE